jgi:hypothetical protein
MAEYEDRAGRISGTGVKVVARMAFISMGLRAVQLTIISIWIARIGALSKTCDRATMR